ncbi:hypothetical protein K439DRAFT_1361559 [Ramaria rubella]|nr:hypothetical protein K439DRAFT_1361559 [Ramaria rubella]
MQLRGIIYHGGYHFTARIIDSNSNCWYYDGIETSTTCIYEGNLKMSQIDLWTVQKRNACILIYSKSSEASN